MTSQRRILANRRNARRSTGPRTPAGKARSRSNALRHGFAAVRLTPAIPSAEVIEFANALAGENPSPRVMQHAVAVAETELRLRKMEIVKRPLLTRVLVPESSLPSERTETADPSELKSLVERGMELELLSRYERPMSARHLRALWHLARAQRDEWERN